jgi:hypothetical protein
MKNTGTCAFSDNNECRILYEKVCLNRKCTFYKNLVDYKRDNNRDFLYESYLNGDISEIRYLYLCKKYPLSNRTGIGEAGENNAFE